MTECCCPERATAARQPCPACSALAGLVEVSTLKALLTASALGRLQLGCFHFCANPTCDTVYFSDADQRFHLDDVRVAVWQKQPPGSRTLCYCFGENEAAMQNEIASTGSTAAVDRVRSHVSARRCACEVRNPRGACCLGDLIAAAKRLGSLQGTPA